MIVDNQQVNVVANEVEIEVEQRIIIYTLLKVKFNPTPILEIKFVVMDDTFYIIRFKRVMQHITNKKSQSKL